MFISNDRKKKKNKNNNNNCNKTKLRWRNIDFLLIKYEMYLRNLNVIVFTERQNHKQETISKLTMFISNDGKKKNNKYKNNN